MFSYYGSKSKVIDYYPSPKYDTIGEPLAGSARYALKWFDRDVFLIDCRPVVIDTWHYLQQATPAEVLSLPRPAYKQSLDEFSLSAGERYLLGWLSGRGATHPRKVAQKWAALDRDLKSIAGQLYKIRHWNITLGDYQDAPNIKATWFIDPPYQFGGGSYRTGPIDYKALAGWIKTRQGQVIACENTRANWLDFWPLRENRGSRNTTTEAIWSNCHTGFEATQETMW